MELRQLEQFVAVADEGQFTAAAARCNISQSALSTSIRALERELRATLFVRTTRRVALTATGEALLAEARRTLAAAAAARAAVHEVQGLLRGSLAVGGVPTASVLDQPALLARFREMHPRVEVRYVRGTSTALLDEIRNARLDLAFVSLPERTPVGLAIHEIASRPLVLICRPDHRLASRSELTLKELAQESFVGGPPGSMAHRWVDQIFAAAGAEPAVPFEVNDVPTMLDFVAHGLGVAVLVEEVAAQRTDLCTVPLADRAMVWTLAAVTPPEEQTSRAARELLRLVTTR